MSGFYFITACVLLATLPLAASSITRAEVVKALGDWGNGLISIATAKAKKQDYFAAAKSCLSQL
jgi:hypothetical protein